MLVGWIARFTDSSWGLLKKEDSLCRRQRLILKRNDFATHQTGFVFL
jgi:hypothetical protein